jgi:hypothetical protein
MLLNPLPGELAARAATSEIGGLQRPNSFHEKADLGDLPVDSSAKPPFEQVWRLCHYQTP